MRTFQSAGAATLLSIAAALSACGSPQLSGENQLSPPPDIEIIKRADLAKLPLNPARGDASPQASHLWGDITKDVSSGIILEFADGFTSPPHIHNITYRSIVIEGAIHNDDPEAAISWMEPGSFWTQPAGEDHITAARPGEKGVGFLEILEGPYLVQPSDEAFDNGAEALNLHYDDMVWLSPSESAWLTGGSESKYNPRITYLWGNPDAGELGASLVKLPSGFIGHLSANGEELRSVVIKGEIKIQLENDESLSAGSYFKSTGQGQITLSCDSSKDCLIYMKTKDTFNLKSAR